MKPVSIAEAVFGAWRVSFEQLPTGDVRQSDWLVQIDGVHYLIEEKTKLDNPELVRSRTTALDRGEIYSQSLSLASSNGISKRLKKAASQVASSAFRQSADFRLAWLTGIGHDAEARRYQFISTLYGSTQIWERGGPGVRPCYFFRESEFFRNRRSLHGAIASSMSPDGSTLTMFLCLNPLAEGWQGLRDSPLSRHFTTGLVNPLSEEASGEAYVADCGIDRKDSAAVLTYLQEKYGTGLLGNMDFSMISAVASAPAA